MAETAGLGGASHESAVPEGQAPNNRRKACQRSQTSISNGAKEMNENAVVIGKLGGGYYLAVRLWTGEKVTMHRARIPWRGKIEIGDELDVVVKKVSHVISVKKPAAAA
jgi:hypothetical protein